MLIGLSNQEATQVQAGKINYHIVAIKPENDDLHNQRMILGRQLETLKLKVGYNF